MEVSGKLHAPTSYLRGKSIRYPVGGRLGGPQSRPGRFGVEDDHLSLPAVEPRPELSL
jgi:hypothetical protein